MADISTTYMGIALKSPVVVAACSLSGKMDKVRQAEESGAGALVIKSLFEEQILHEMQELDAALEEGTEAYAESLSFFPKVQHGGAQEHLMLVREIREAVQMPVIASVNAVHPGSWVDYARQLAETGVDGLELNVYALETDLTRDAADIENRMLDTFSAVKEAVSLPIAVKLSPFYTSVGNVVTKLQERGAAAVVLFNRFLQPEIDPATEKLRHTAALSAAGELRLPLRWVALLYGQVGLDIAGNTGIGTSKDVAKFILAGASVTQVASTLFRNGMEHVATMNAEISDWMDEKSYASLADCRGKLSAGKAEGDTFALERAHYLDYVLQPGKG
jgi:dihydroorotate dehydrogenase (fumarate)